MSRMRYANVLWMRASRSGAIGTHDVIGLGAHILWRWVDCAQQNGIKVGINAGGGGAAAAGSGAGSSACDMDESGSGAAAEVMPVASGGGGDGDVDDAEMGADDAS